jgi:hypothetical protein
MMKKYIIETITYCDGWINTWTDDDENPVVFDTLQDAEQELALYLMELGIDADLGNIVDYNPEDFRITEIEK